MVNKHLLLFLTVLLINVISYSQTLIPYTKEVDSVFVNLNKSQITSGILYDRIIPFAYLNMFNTSEANTSSNNHFSQAYYELYNCAYDASDFVKTDTLKARIKRSINSGYIPIGILNYKFNQIDTNAIVKNLIYERDGLFYDVIGRSSTPYWLKQVTILSPLVDSVFGLQIKFKTSADFYLQNTGKAIASLYADFGNGSGLVDIGLNNSIVVNYAIEGTKVIRFLIKYNDNSEITTYAAIKVLEPDSDHQRRGIITPCDKDEWIFADIPFTDYDNNTFKGQGNIRYYFATNDNCNGKVKKPIIVLDGFDPEDSRDINHLYKDFLNNSERYMFADQLRSQGYDIVILNFPNYKNELNREVDGGSDYIERNAFVLVKLIKKLNLELVENGSEEKLVIIGPSMGGLISRYALAYMEKEAMPTNTRLWISFDSPHKGANISIGVQAFLKYYADKGNESAKKNLNVKLSNPAAKQMLLHHISSNSYQAMGAPGFRERFVNNLTSNGLSGSNGFPQNVRKVALVDGSLNGILQPDIASCTKAVNMKTFFAEKVLFLFKVRFFRVAQADVFSSGSYGRNCLVFTGSQIFNRSRDYYGFAPASSVSYDIAPGGFNSTFKDVAEGPSFSSFGFLTQLGGNFFIPLPIGEFGTDTKYSLYHPSHCFIPTKSAIAFKGANQDLAENLYDRNLVCTGETPFDTYYGSTTNLEHVYITPTMAMFAIDEINKNQREPSFISPTLPPMSINGTSTICTSATYSIVNLPQNTSVCWSVTNDIGTFPNGDCGNTITVQKKNIGSGQLTATITPACGPSLEISKTITIAQPVTTQVATNLTGIVRTEANYYGYYLNFTPIPDVDVYHMEWFDVTTNSLLNTYPIVNGYFYYYFTSGHTYKYRIAASSACGNGPFSNWSENLLPPGPTCESGPTALTQTGGCGTSGPCRYTNLIWDPIMNANQYQVEYSVFNLTTGQYLPTATQISYYPYLSVDFGDLNGTGWYIRYRVRANCGGGYGNYSQWSFTFFLQ